MTTSLHHGYVASFLLIAHSSITADLVPSLFLQSDDMEGFPAVAASAAAGAKPSPTVGASPLSAALLASPSQATERPISRAFAYRSQAIRQLAAPPSPVPSEEERRGRRGRS